MIEDKRLIVKQAFDSGFFAGKIFKQSKCLVFNNILIYSTINLLFDTNNCKYQARSIHLVTVLTKECTRRICVKMP